MATTPLQLFIFSIEYENLASSPSFRSYLNPIMVAHGKQDAIRNLMFMFQVKSGTQRLESDKKVDLNGWYGTEDEFCKALQKCNIDNHGLTILPVTAGAGILYS
jgi:hypothetical protein